MTGAGDRCRAVLPGGAPCPDRAQPGHPYCARHTGPMRSRSPGSPREFMRKWLATVEGVVERRLSGQAPPREDHDPELVRALLPVVLPLYYWYWRVDVVGVENVPTEGAAVLAANHSGALPIDGLMLKIAVLKEHGRNPWLLAADLAFQFPGLRRLLRVAGNARADREETLELLRRGELIGVFPEGFKGIGKGWRKRYQLQRFGRGGFVEVAMETGAPIVPVGIIGAEEIYPMIANAGFLARRLGLPYLPITPTFPLLGPLGLVPLPSKWIIAIGEPIGMVEHGPKAAQDTQLVLETTEQVRGAVQALLREHLPRRKNMFV